MIGQKQWPTITVSLGALALALSSVFVVVVFFAFTSNWLWAREISWDNNDSNNNNDSNWSVIGNKTHSSDCNLIVSGQQVNGKW